MAECFPSPICPRPSLTAWKMRPDPRVLSTHPKRSGQLMASGLGPLAGSVQRRWHHLGPSMLVGGGRHAIEASHPHDGSHWSSGHSPIPSLFTFQVNDRLIEGLQGLSIEDVSSHLPWCDIRSHGPLLLTHWGLSGPAILKLSSWAARNSR